MINFIFNADDFGLSDENNQAIKYAFENGYVNQTSLLLGFDSTEAAVNIAKENGFSDVVGCHINLNNGTPLSDMMKKVPLFVKEGKFNEMGASKYDRSRIKNILKYINPIKDEMRKQIEKYLSYDLKFMHLDVHYNYHQNIPIVLALRPLLKEYGFKSARGYIYKRFYGDRYIKYNKFVDSVFYWGGTAKADVSMNGLCFEKWIQSNSLDGKVIEIFSHPTIIDGKYIDNYTQGRTLEETLGKIQNMYKEQSKFITYYDIRKK